MCGRRVERGKPEHCIALQFWAKEAEKKRKKKEKTEKSKGKDMKNKDSKVADMIQ